MVAGQVWSSPGGYSHHVTNLGAETIRFLDAEILETPPSETGAAAVGDFSWHPGGLLPALENRDAAPLPAVEVEWRGNGSPSRGGSPPFPSSFLAWS